MLYKRLNSAEGFLLWVMEPWRIVILTFWTFLKLKTTFCKYWIPIKIKISMVCIHKTFELYGPFLWIGFNYINATATKPQETIYFLPRISQKSLVLILSTSEGWKLNRPWSHPVVLTNGLMDWEFSALTTRSTKLK